MEYKTFESLMKRLLKLRRDEEKLNKALKAFEPDSGYFSLGRIETLIVDAIKAGMNDSFDDISWWLYDMNEGKNTKKDSITTKDGKNIPCKTLKDLYNLIKYDN
jgi:hypothetical protein